MTDPKPSASIRGLAAIAKLDALRQYARDKVAETRDLFYNAITGAGTSSSKTSAARYVESRRLDAYDCEVLLRDNDLAQQIAYKIVEDSIGSGFAVKRKNVSPLDSETEVTPTKLLEKWNELHGFRQLSAGAQAARGFGGGGLIIVATGSGDAASPLVPERVTSIDALLDWDIQDLEVHTRNGDGSPKVYAYTPQIDGDNRQLPIYVHASRVLVFPGAPTTRRERAKNKGFDNSVLQRVIEALRSFDGMWSSVDVMLADCSQAVFKLQDFIGSLASTQDAGTRLQLLDLYRSVHKALVLDAGTADEPGESFEVIERTTLGTLAPVMNNYFVRLGAAARMPLTVLLGMSPAGMDATGDADMKLWYKSCTNYRFLGLQPHALFLVRLIARTLGDKNPEEWEIVWPELQLMSPMETATATNMRVTSLATLITSEVYLPEEVALSLPDVLPELGIVADLAARRGRLKDALQELEEGELNEPEGEVPAESTTERTVPSRAAGGSQKA